MLSSHWYLAHLLDLSRAYIAQASPNYTTFESFNPTAGRARLTEILQRRLTTIVKHAHLAAEWHSFNLLLRTITTVFLSKEVKMSSWTTRLMNVLKMQGIEEAERSGAERKISILADDVIS